MDLDASACRNREIRTLGCLILTVLAGGTGVGVLAGASLHWEPTDLLACYDSELRLVQRPGHQTRIVHAPDSYREVEIIGCEIG